MIKTNKLFAFTVAVLMSFALYAHAAEQNTFQPESGGYHLELPADRVEIYRTTKGIRYIEGTQLINTDIYPLPNFLAVPMKNYSEQQISDFEKFISQIEDYAGFTLKKSSLTQSSKNVSNKFAPKLVLDEKGYAFTLQPPANSSIVRDFIVGKAYQLSNDRLLVVRVSAPEKDRVLAQNTLNVLTHNFKISKPKYIDNNIIKAKNLNYEITLPSGWHAFTMLADNIIMAKSLSSVHNDEALIRSFKTKSFTALANADAKNMATKASEFVEKITKFTPNVKVIKHESIVANGINGIIIESTELVNLKKIFVVNAYFFAKDDSAYQIKFTTDDTINSDIKINAFKNAIKSFQKTIK